MIKKTILAIVFFAASAALFIGASPGVVLANGTPPPPQSTPAPSPGASATPVPQGSTIYNNIINTLQFPSERISESLSRAFSKPGEEFYEYMVRESGIDRIIFTLFRPPEEIDYRAVAGLTLPIAGALAVPLFLLRLALHQWSKLFGEEEKLMTVIGDWVTAGFLAFVSGPFLVLLVNVGYWTLNEAVGGEGNLVLKVENVKANFEAGSSLASTQESLGSGIFYGLLSGVLGFLILLALVGLVMAFFVIHSVLYLLAYLGPVLAVISVIPQARWLRGLWIKAATVLALMPLLAGAVFSSGFLLIKVYQFESVITPLLWITWLMGATGLLFSVVGMLGKLTVGASIDAAKGLVGAVKGVVDVAGAAALAVSTGGTGTAAIGAGKLAGGAATGAKALDASQRLNAAGGISRAFGLNRTSGMFQTLSRGADLEARKLGLQQRVDKLGKPSSVQARSESEKRALHPGLYKPLEPRMAERSLTPENFINANAAQFEKMLNHYHSHRNEIDQDPDPLMRAAKDSRADSIVSMLNDAPKPLK